MTRPKNIRHPLVCALCGAPFLGWRRDQRHCSRKCRSVSEARPAAERFWAKVDQSGDCWLWTAGRTSTGYGTFRVSVAPRRTEQAHRFSWELTHGPVPTGLLVCHRCDNPPCVNPAHLFLGTHADNSADMDTKGRRVSMVGETNRWAKLTDGDVREIRRLLAEGSLSQRRIGERFGVTQGTVGNIKWGRSWRHI